MQAKNYPATNFLKYSVFLYFDWPLLPFLCNISDSTLRCLCSHDVDENRTENSYFNNTNSVKKDIWGFFPTLQDF